MAYGTTLAWKRGYITKEERQEFHQLAHDVGLSLDHEQFDEELLKVSTEAILKTRDGKQWFAEPRPLGTCYFINDASMEELYEALREHKQIIRSEFPDRAKTHGVGQDAFVDKSDLGMDPEGVYSLDTDRFLLTVYCRAEGKDERSPGKWPHQRCQWSPSVRRAGTYSFCLPSVLELIVHPTGRKMPARSTDLS